MSPFRIELLIVFELILCSLVIRLHRSTRSIRDWFTITFDLFYNIEFGFSNINLVKIVYSR